MEDIPDPSSLPAPTPIPAHPTRSQLRSHVVLFFSQLLQLLCSGLARSGSSGSVSHQYSGGLPSASFSRSTCGALKGAATQTFSPSSKEASIQDPASLAAAIRL